MSEHLPGPVEMDVAADTAGDAGDTFEDVAAAADIIEGTLVQATLAHGAAICLFNHEGEIGAVDDTCTHAEFSMSEGVLHHDGTIECVWHGARFNCWSGAVCRGPACDALPVYEVRVEDGRVLVGRRSPRPRAR